MGSDSRAWVLPSHLADFEKSKEVRCSGSVQLAKHQRVLFKFIRFSSILWALIEIRILHPVLCKPLEFELFVLTSSRPSDTHMGMLRLNAHLSGKVYDECLETVENITETINYPLVRKEARAPRLLIKSWLIVLHVHSHSLSEVCWVLCLTGYILSVCFSLTLNGSLVFRMFI